jgi:hypothetical protein
VDRQIDAVERRPVPVPGGDPIEADRVVDPYRRASTMLVTFQRIIPR